MSDLGQRLRAAREAKGLTLAQAEEATRIRRDFLAALEEERYEALPGVVYVKGFLRNYATYLGLDPQASVAEYQAAVQPEDRESGAAADLRAPAGSELPHVLSEPLLVASRRDPVRVAIVVLLALLVIGAGAWYLYNRLVLSQTPWPFSLIATRLAPTTTPTRPAPTSTAQAAGTAASVSPTLPADATPTASQTPTTEAPVSPTVTGTATPTRTAIPTATPSQPSPTPSPTLGGGFLVTLRVNAVCYVRVVVDGQMVLEKNLAVGEDQRWEPKQSLTMRVGNAGGVVLAINGVDQPPLGANDQIADVSYTLDSLP